MPSDLAPNDLTLAELRLALAPAIADAAVFDGWSDAALAAAAEGYGVSADVARIAFPEGGVAMIEAFSAWADVRMAAQLPTPGLLALPVRERIARLLRFRLDAYKGREEALRRALAVLARPRNLARAARADWHAADAMWRQAGDTSADFAWYSKRTTLAGIYAATLAVYAYDESAGHADAYAFLDRRIAGIIRFEKAKARLFKPADEHFSVARFLGRLRYPAR